MSILADKRCEQTAVSDVGTGTSMKLVALEVWRGKDTKDLSADSISRSYGLDHLQPGVGVYPKWIMALEGFDNTVPRRFCLLGK